MASIFHVVMLILGGVVVVGVVVVGGVEDVQVSLAKWYQGCGVGMLTFLRVLPSCAANSSAKIPCRAEVGLVVIIVIVVAASYTT